MPPFVWKGLINWGCARKLHPSTLGCHSILVLRLMNDKDRMIS